MKAAFRGELLMVEQLLDAAASLNATDFVSPYCIRPVYQVFYLVCIYIYCREVKRLLC